MHERVRRTFHQQLSGLRLTETLPNVWDTCRRRDTAHTHFHDLNLHAPLRVARLPQDEGAAVDPYERPVANTA